MRRILSVAMTLLLVFSFAAGIQARPASAQATAGEAVSITDAAGVPLLEVSIDSFTPDFTGYDRNYAPDRGFQYAHITVTITNVGTTAFAPSSYGFTLIDTDGFVNDTAFIVVDESQAPASLDGDELEPGASVTASVVFQMLAGTEAAAVAFSVSYDRLTLLATNGETPAIGETVAVLGPDGQPMLNVTIDEWLDPLPDVDSSAVPSRGHHFAGAVVTIENVSNGAFPLDPWSFKLLDSDGYEANGSNPYRPEPEIEDLPYADLEAGESMTGVVGFQVFNGATPTFIAFETSDQMALVAGFPDAPVIPELSTLPEVEAPAAPVDSSDDADDATDEENADDQAGAAPSEECEAADAWMNEFFEQLEDSQSEASEFDFSEAADMSADELTDVRDSIEAMLDEIDAAEVPALAQGVVDAYVDIMEYSIDSLDTLIEAAENGDDLQPLIDEILEDNELLGAYFVAFDEYLESCPAEE